jgi:hypothetical protein
MKEVFILGAGFSKAVNSLMPSLTELSIKVKERCGSDKLPPPLLNFGDNIELWLTYLSQPQPWLKETHNLQNRALFIYMTEIIGQVLDEITKEVVGQDCPDWFCSLMEWWHKNKSNVITFNYDTLIERAIPKALKGADIEMPDVYPVSFPNIMSRRATLPEGFSKPSFLLFKLHGSVNWYYSGASSFYGEVLYRGAVAKWGESFDWENQSKSEASDKVPLIVPPTTEKATYFQHETLRQIWLKASAALDAATRIYCVGYSLPPTDLGVRFFLQHSKYSTKVPLVIVNKDKSIVERYKDLLGNSYEIDETYAATGISALVKNLT